MSDSMTIGPAMQIGGNTVELRLDGKVQVTNPKGKIKTLTQDEFKKQTIKNADKIEAGEDFEYKKDHKALKIAGAAAATAAVSLGIIYRKEIGKYMKNFTFKKFWNDVKGLFKSTKNKDDVKNSPYLDRTPIKYSVFSGKKTTLSEKAKAKLNDAKIASAEKEANDTLELKRDAIEGMARDFDKREALHMNDLNKNYISRVNKYEELFRDYDQDAVVECLSKGVTPEELGFIKREDFVKIDDPKRTIDPWYDMQYRLKIDNKPAGEVFNSVVIDSMKAQWEKFHPAK